MEQFHILLFVLFMRAAFADVNPDLLDGVFFRRQTKEVKDSELDKSSDKPASYLNFDHPVVTHLKPEKPKPQVPHIPNLSNIAIILKPNNHDSYANKPEYYQHTPETYTNDNKHDALYPFVYPMYYPAGLPNVWDNLLLNNMYHAGVHGGSYHTTDKPPPCHTTESPSHHTTNKPLHHYPIIEFPIQHLPVYHTTHKPDHYFTTHKHEHYYTTEKPNHYSTTHKPDHHYPTDKPEDYYKPDEYHHHYDTHDPKPQSSKPDKPTLTSIFPQLLWPFYSRPKDKNSQTAEDSDSTSVLYPLYKENKKRENIQGGNLRPNEENSNVKSTTTSETKTK